MKRFFLILTCLTLLCSIESFGQNQRYKLINEVEQNLLNDLSTTFQDTSISFVVAPLITHTITFSDIDIPNIVNKYGFNKKQFIKKSIDTLSIKNNKCFTVIDQDSLLKYNNLVFDTELCIEKGIDPLQSPILYYVEREYNKGGICYFYKPVFSTSRSYAIVEYWIHCGFLYGWGELVLMKKIDNKWIIIETLMCNES